MGAYSYIGERGAVSGTISSFAGSGLTASVQILADNPKRVSAVLYNGLDREAFVSFGLKASVGGLYTLRIASGSFYETAWPYAGPMALVVTSASLTGTFQVTETY